MSAHTASQTRQTLTVEEYLELERTAEYKSEYLEGDIVAMAGSSPEHSSITVNIVAHVATQLRGKRCRAHSSDIKTLARNVTVRT